MRGVQIRGGVTAATLASGPVFAATMFAAEGVAWGRSLPQPWEIFALLLWAIPFGAFLGVTPNLIGAWAMASASRQNVALRLPVMWVLAGAGGGALIGAVANWQNTAETAVPFMAAVGAICAGICRLFTRWDD